MRDWFATLRKPRATGATGATASLDDCNTSLSDSPAEAAQVGNRWATQATGHSTDSSRPSSVAQVAHWLPNESADRVTAEAVENRGSQRSVAQVAQVAHQNRASSRDDHSDAWDALDWQAFFDERAAIAEYDGNVSRVEAEARAFKWCINEWMEQHPEPSLPDRCAWCNEPDVSGTAVVPFGTQSHGHTWLHPECWHTWFNDRRDRAEQSLMEFGIERSDHQIDN